MSSQGPHWKQNMYQNENWTEIVCKMEKFDLCAILFNYKNADPEFEYF